MRVFVTGATGFIGSAIVPELIAAGHHVVGLARSDRAVAQLAAAGADAHRGDLTDLDSLYSGAAGSDGVVHTAFIHDFSNIAASGEIDLRAVQTLGTALENSGRPLVIASGVALVAPGRVATETDAADPNSAGSHRVPSERTAIALAHRGVRSAVVRLAPTVHGEGDHGFVSALIDITRNLGVSAYVGDGANRWPAVHRLDAAHLFRLALESAPAATVLHGVGEEGVRIRDIAEAIGHKLEIEARGISADKAADHFGFLAGFLAADLPTSSALTRDRFGWEPTHPTLLDDLAHDFYYEAAPALASQRN
jgi:nucleoside-diphosphate-sugar epimerase